MRVGLSVDRLFEVGWQMCEGEQQQPPRLNPLYRGGVRPPACGMPDRPPATLSDRQGGYDIPFAWSALSFKYSSLSIHGFAVYTIWYAILTVAAYTMPRSDPCRPSRPRPTEARPGTHEAACSVGWSNLHVDIPFVSLPPNVSIKKDPALTGSSCPDMQAAERLTLCHTVDLTAR